MEKPTEQHWKAVRHVVGYFKKEMEEKGTCALRICQPKNLNIVGWTDSDFATDTDDRKSISGYILTLGGAIVNWHSKKQQ